MIDPLVEQDYVFSERYPERARVYRTIADASARARQDCTGLFDLAYGPHPRERLDIFPGPAGAPLLIFVHGGYWRSHEKSSFSFVAPTFLARGISVAIVGYPLAPERSIGAVIRSVHDAVHWLANEGRGYLSCPSSVVICGHSAGGHLAAMTAVGSTRDNRPTGKHSVGIVGCVTLSGLFDLRPLARTSIAKQVGLVDTTLEALSPLTLAAGPGWLLAAVGSAETDGFLGQTTSYVSHWQKSGANSCKMVLPDVNHYTILLELNRPDSPIVQAMSQRMEASTL